MKKLNIIIAILIIGINAFWLIPASIVLIYTNGGPMGWGFLLLPFTIIGHVFVITAIRALRNKSSFSKPLIVINTVGLIWLCFLIYWALSNDAQPT